MCLREKERLRGLREQVMTMRARAREIEDIKVEVDHFSEKIARRIEELEKEA